MSETPFLFKAMSPDGSMKSVSMSALNWPGVWGGTSDDELTEYTAYQVVSWTRRCVELRANAMSTIPASIRRQGA